MSTLELSEKLRTGMTAHQIGLVIGAPDKVQKGMQNYQEDEYFYYDRRDGVLQIHLSSYQGLISYQTY